MTTDSDYFRLDCLSEDIIASDVLIRFPPYRLPYLQCHPIECLEWHLYQFDLHETDFIRYVELYFRFHLVFHLIFVYCARVTISCIRKGSSKRCVLVGAEFWDFFDNWSFWCVGSLDIDVVNKEVISRNFPLDVEYYRAIGTQLLIYKLWTGLIGWVKPKML